MGVGAGLKPAPMERAKLSVLQTSVYKSVTELTSQYTCRTTNGDERIPFGLPHLVVQCERRKIQPETSALGLVTITSREVLVRDTVMVIHRNGQGSPDHVIVLTFEYSEGI